MADAKAEVLINAGDIHEGTYRFVVIEELRPGLYPAPPVSEHWFEWLEHKVNYTGVREFRRYEERRKPRRFMNTVNFGIG